MAGKKKLGCGPVGLLIIVMIVLGVISSDDDEEVPVSPTQQLTAAPAGSSAPAGRPIVPQIRYVIADTLNVRASPATNAPVLLQVERGAVVRATRQDGSWYGVPLSDGSIGWLHGDYLADRQPSAPSRFISSPRPATSSSTGCHPSYVGRCLPIGRDLDCADLAGSVGVVGPDVYRLDRDNDGVGCE